MERLCSPTPPLPHPPAECAHLLLLLYAPQLLLRLPPAARQSDEEEAEGVPSLASALKARLRAAWAGDWEALIADLELDATNALQHPRLAAQGIIDHAELKQLPRGPERALYAALAKY